MSEEGKGFDHRSLSLIQRARMELEERRDCVNRGIPAGLFCMPLADIRRNLGYTEHEDDQSRARQNLIHSEFFANKSLAEQAGQRLTRRHGFRCEVSYERRADLSHDWQLHVFNSI